MGNLRSNFTDQEWSEMQRKIKSDTDKGKPTKTTLTLPISNKSTEELMKIRNFLLVHFNDYELTLLDQWIKWKQNTQE